MIYYKGVYFFHVSLFLLILLLRLSLFLINLSSFSKIKTPNHIVHLLIGVNGCLKNYNKNMADILYLLTMLSFLAILSYTMSPI